jgi:hypothetical protein
MRNLALGCALLLSLFAYAPALAAEEVQNRARVERESAEPALPQAPDGRLYEKYKCKYACIDGEWIRLPDFDLKYENSRRGAPFPESAKWDTVCTTEYQEREDGPGTVVGTWPNTHIVRQTRSFPVEVKTLRPVPDDVLADRVRRWRAEIPRLGVGEFGFWPDGEPLSILQIRDAGDMVVSGGGQTIWVKGVSTVNLYEGHSLSDGFFGFTTVSYSSPTVAESVTVNASTRVNATTPVKVDQQYRDNEAQVKVRVRNETAEKAIGTDVSASSEETRKKVVTADLGAPISVAIIATRPIEGYGAARVLLAIPTAQIRSGLTRDQFASMLRDGVDPERDDAELKGKKKAVFKLKGE